MTSWALPSGHDRLPHMSDDDGVWLLPSVADDYEQGRSWTSAESEIWSPRPIRPARPRIPWYSWATVAFIAATMATGLVYAVRDLIRLLH